MATVNIGQTLIGSQTVAVSANTRALIRRTLDASFVNPYYIQSLSVYASSSYPSAKIKIGIYSDITPKPLIWVSTEKVGLSAGWNTINLRDSPLLQNLPVTPSAVYIFLHTDTLINLTCGLTSGQNSYTIADTYSDGPATALGTLGNLINNYTLGLYLTVADGTTQRKREYVEYFLKSNSDIVQLETFEISHPSFSRTYYIVRNSTTGLTATDENGNSRTFEYYPVKITPVSARDNLDTGLKITFGDLGELLPSELDLVATANTFTTKPILKYRTYRSDVLTTPLYGPINLEISDISFTREGATFEAKAPAFNINKTGQLYTVERFPMLRGFL